MPDEKHHTARSLYAGENPVIAYWDISLWKYVGNKEGMLHVKKRGGGEMKTIYVQIVPF